MRKIKRIKIKYFINYLYIIPAFIIYAVFFLSPLFRTFHLSFFKWDIINPKEFIGFKNYIDLFKDSLFYNSLINNGYWCLLSVIIPVSVGLILAYLVARGGIKGQRFFRLCYFLPVVMSSAVAGIIWSWIYHPNWGVLNIFLRSIGLGFLARGWLGDADITIFALIIVNAWMWFGFCFVVYFAGLQNIDEELYNAAKVDGANFFRQFIHIAVPGLRNQSTLLIIITFINSLKVFDLPFVLTQGGPYKSSYVLGYYVWDAAFNFRQVGYASAIASILTIIILISTIIFLRFREREA